jgi:Protein of unknown function (DUF2442)
MTILDEKTNTRVEGVRFEADAMTVTLADGRKISAPLAWFPRLLNATPQQRQNWTLAAGGHGIHWPDIDEDLSTEGLLRGTPAPASKPQGSA